MANRFFNDRAYGLEKFPVTLYAELNGKGAAAPDLLNQAGTAVTSFHGIKSVTRNGVGDYTITLQDTYQRVLGIQFTTVSKNASAPTAWATWVKAINVQAAGGATINFITYGAALGTPVELSATTDKVYVEIILSNSNAP